MFSQYKSLGYVKIPADQKERIRTPAGAKGAKAGEENSWRQKKRIQKGRGMALFQYANRYKPKYSGSTVQKITKKILPPSCNFYFSHHVLHRTITDLL